MRLSTLFLLAGVTSTALATPFSRVNLADAAILSARFVANEVVNPAAVTGTTCTSPGTSLVDHDINVALLSICGGISGTIEQCQGSPTTTTGAFGDATFTLKAQSGTIDISKGRWEGCVRAARAVCGDSPFTSTCIGGAEVNNANVDFTLGAV
jgi:hypothetical protein